MNRAKEILMALEGIAVEVVWVAGICLFGLAVAAIALALV